MSNIPDIQTRNKSVNNMRKVCRQLDALTFQLDEIIARLETDIRQHSSERHCFTIESKK
jgi:hypothetical protein